MASIKGRRAANGSHGAGGVVWLGAAILLGVALLGGFGWLKVRSDAKAVDAGGCLSNAAAPVAVLFMVDATDRLNAKTAAYVVDTIRNEEQDLPRYARVILTPFGDDVATPLQPLIRACLPGRSDDAGLDENGRYLQVARDAFNARVDRLTDDLQQLTPSKTSPIAAQVVRAASDPILQWTGRKRRLVLLSDGLETSVYWTRGLHLPDPPSHLLDDVDVEFVELGNARGARLQSDELREAWKTWFEKAGASVRMTAPGYAAD